MRWLDGITDAMGMNMGKLWEMVRDGEDWWAAVHGVAKSQLTGRDADAGKDRRQEKKGPTEDEMVGWHHRLDGHEFEQALGVGDGQGRLVCCSPWGRKESDTTEQLN